MKKRGSVDVLPVIVFLLSLAVLLFGALLSFDATAQGETSNQTSSETLTPGPSNVTIELSKTKYLKGQQLEGKLLLRVTNSTNLDETVTLRIPGFVKKQKLSELLRNASVNHTVAKGRYEGVNPSSTKTLQISENQPKTVGVILPAFSDVVTFNMAVSGPANNQLKTPYMDVGLDGVIDWYYLGNFVQWNRLPTAPVGLIESLGDKVIINNGGESATLYCQRMNLPFSKDFNVTASYKSLNAGGDLKAVIYSVIGDPAFPQGGSDICDLPESASSTYHSCTLRFRSAERDDHLVCVYNDVQPAGDAYELNADTGRETSTAFACQRTEPVFCEPATTSNYFIKVSGADYSEFLASNVNFDEWSLGINASLEALKKEIGSQPYPGNCAPGLCLVPIEVNGVGSGTVTLSNLGIRYETGGAARTVGQTDKLYDVVRKPDTIETLNGVPLTEPKTIEIPISLFNFIADAPERAGAVSASSVLEAGYGNNLEARSQFTIFFESIPAEGSQILLNEVRDSINALPKDVAGSLLTELSGIDEDARNAQNQLTTFESRLVSGDTPELQSEIETFRANLPQSATAKGTLADIQVIEPNDITDDITSADKKEEVYFLQDDATITTKISRYEVTYFSGIVKNYAVIQKTVKANKNLNKVDVYESISKSISASVSSVKFKETPKIVNDDPVVKWFISSLQSGQTKEYSYLVESEAMDLDDFKTIIVPSKPANCGNQECDEDEDGESCPEDCKPLAKCGDGVCTEILEDKKTCPKDCKAKFPWLFLIVILLVFGGSAALYYFKFMKKSPFKKPQDLKLVTDYIKSAKQKKVKNEDIEKALMQRGWKKEQIDYAFEQVLSSVNVKPMQEYIKASIAKKVPAAAIKQKLISQGWDEILIEKELKQSGKPNNK